MYFNTGKGKAFFRDVYDWPIISEQPVSKELFIKAGISAEVFEQYIALICRLYGAYYIANNSVAAKYISHNTSLDVLWQELVDFCIDNNLVLEFSDADGQRMPVYAPNELRHFRFVYFYSECPDFIHICELDEFRLAVEKLLADIIEEEQYLSIEYGVAVDRNYDCETLIHIFGVNGNNTPLSREDASALLESIADKLQELDDAQEILASNVPGSKTPMTREEFLHLDTLCKEWLEKRISLDRKRTVLIDCRNLVTSILDSGVLISTQNVYTDDTLYIYKGQICCLKNKHRIEEAVAVLMDRNGRDIELNVMHCLDCDKFFLEYSIYQHYREKYGSILGNLRMIKNGTFDHAGVELADESPLRLCGYSVSQKAGLSQAERQSIIESCILSGAMTKSAVINLLKWFIEVNGAKWENARAVEKWNEDLDFALAYNTANQNRYRVTKIEKYNRNRFQIRKSSVPVQECITYYRVWKLKIFDGSYAYGVEFSTDKGKTWTSGNSFSSEAEAEQCLRECLNEKLTNKRWDS